MKARVTRVCVSLTNHAHCERNTCHCATLDLAYYCQIHECMTHKVAFRYQIKCLSCTRKRESLESLCFLHNAHDDIGNDPLPDQMLVMHNVKKTHSSAHKEFGSYLYSICHIMHSHHVVHTIADHMDHDLGRYTICSHST
jgi:hypothetical protein